MILFCSVLCRLHFLHFSKCIWHNNFIDALVLTSSTTKNSSKQAEEGSLDVTFKRKDYTVERIGCLHNRQDTINGELEFLKLKMEEKKNALGIANNRKSKPLNIF